MIEQQDRLAYLLEKFRSNQVSEAEFRELLEYARDSENESRITDLWTTDLETAAPQTYDKAYWSLFFKTMFEKSRPAKLHHFRRRTWLRVAAAAVLLFAFMSAYLWLNHQPKTELANSNQSTGTPLADDVPPGQYKAKLTLADGRTIILDSATAGKLATQGGTVVVNKDGQLVYQSSDNTKEVLYNTLTTAKGETYATVLADGSKVWLNAASSIKFPVAFTGNERKIEITGEAYFEVKHNDQMPFVVLVNGMEVQDLGTEFNINAYFNEPVIQTTLVKGAASVTNNGQTILLEPGKMAVVKGKETKLADANLQQATAWKNGNFFFKSMDIESIMRQIGRWYDVDIKYEAEKPKGTFSGIVSRSKKLSEVVRVLEQYDVHCTIEGHTLIVK